MIKVSLISGDTEYYAILGGMLIYQGTNRAFKRTASSITGACCKFDMPINKSLKGIANLISENGFSEVIKISSALYEYDALY